MLRLVVLLIWMIGVGTGIEDESEVNRPREVKGGKLPAFWIRHRTGMEIE